LPQGGRPEGRTEINGQPGCTCECKDGYSGAGCNPTKCQTSKEKTDKTGERKGFFYCDHGEANKEVRRIIMAKGMASSIVISSRGSYEGGEENNDNGERNGFFYCDIITGKLRRR
jgi:hypothetical protein